VYNKRISIIFIIFINAFFAFGQECSLSISGQVTDRGTNVPLSFVNVFVQELHRGAITDDDGYYLIENICDGDYHLIFSHIGCSPINEYVHVHGDVELNLQLAHSSFSLDQVEVKGSKTRNENLPSIVIDRQKIEDNINQNLSALIENETGVHLIKNGNGISKPIIHGMYGNRVTILNNGVPQSGQQWGNDHSPEIDPFSADKITVLKGANALAYANGNVGGVILVEPRRIGREPHLHGQVNYALESNGRGHNGNFRLERYNGDISWRINSTLKRYGDRKTPSYFLNNTGSSEVNASLQLEKSWNDELFLDFYGSTFNTTLGVLRGSHISNVPDLEDALERDIPLYTEEEFSYGIDAPKQEVSHNLLKLKSKYYVDESQSVEGTIALQINDRKEYDIRRGGRTETPAMDLSQSTINIELKYTKSLENSWRLRAGNQYSFSENENDASTGILPLMPDYLQTKNGLYALLSKEEAVYQIDLGLRYDYEFQNVAAISGTIPREILRYKNNFHTGGSFLGVQYNLAPTSSISLQTGYSMRNPAINELYSNGLHQGVSGIEEGDENLKREKSFKNTMEYNWFPNSKINFNALAYYQHIDDYIYLEPQDEIRLTIRGAFPVFAYEQTNAVIYGLDASAQATLGSSMFGVLKYSYLKGHDVSNDIPLVFMPPNSLFGSLTYRSQGHYDLFSFLHLDQLEVGLNSKIVFQQDQLLEEQDFAKAPDSYNLLGFKISTNVYYPDYSLRFYGKVDNLLNTLYRDYLNRQRYFSDDLGRSITVGMKVKF